MDALRAQRLDRQRGRQRRVDPAGDRDHDVAEAVLVDVVAEAELERDSHLLELAESRRDHRFDPVRLLTRLVELDQRHVRRRLALSREGTSAQVA